MNERESMLDILKAPHLWFSHRVQIEKMFDAWCKEHGALRVPQTMVAYMQMRGWLNDEKILEDLKKEKKA